MYKKVSFFILTLFFYHCLVFGQNIETILSTPDDWRGEIFPFPLEFAPEIDFIGFEDIRFAPGWADSASVDFWAYHFTWYIEQKDPITADLLAETFNAYYDGLAVNVLKEQGDSTLINELDKTFCLFLKTNEGFSGKMRIFDSFFTKDYITLHIKVHEQLCEQTNKQLISFNICPKNFEDELWNIFEQVKVIEICE